MSNSDNRVKDLINWVKSDLSQEENPKLGKTQNPYRSEKIRFLRRAEEILSSTEDVYGDKKLNYLISKLDEKETYYKDPITNKTIKSLVNGCSEIDMIFELLKIIQKQTKLNTELTLKSIENGKSH